MSQNKKVKLESESAAVVKSEGDTSKVKVETKQEVKVEVKQEVKVEIKQEVKEKVKEEVKVEVKQEVGYDTKVHHNKKRVIIPYLFELE